MKYITFLLLTIIPLVIGMPVIDKNLIENAMRQVTGDITLALADGTMSAASGENAVLVGANSDSAATGVKGGTNAVGFATPGAAVGFGNTAPPSPSALLGGLF